MSGVIVTGPPKADPGGVILADDGVVAVPRERARQAAEASEAREREEAGTRAAFLEGQLGLDRYGLREKFAELGVTYQSWETYASDGGRS